MKRLFAVLALSIATAFPAIAQTTWNQSAYINRTTSGRSVIFRNVNQSSHWITYCAGALTSSGTIEIDGSADGVNWIAISNLGPLAANQCGSIQAGGYYPAVSALLSSLAGASPSVNATYSASTGVTPTPANAGYATQVNPVTYIPVTAFATQSVSSTAAQLSVITHTVLYGATVYNPNAGAVYVAFGSTTTPFAGGGSGVFMVPLAAGQAMPVMLPPQGISFGNLWVACSTSSTSAVDPASACVVSAFWKSSINGIVPN